MTEDHIGVKIDGVIYVKLEDVKPMRARIEKLEAALRFIAGPSTVEFVDGTYEISETKMLSTYRRRAKRALEGN